MSYLRRRGLSRGTLTSFGLGFAPDGWDYLIRELSAQGYDKRDLLDAGLAVNNKDGRIYDRFRNRVMFPIIDVRGSVIGFGGRVMDDSTPKYLNSPDTPVYNKSRNVFALNIAKKSKTGRVILTEGYMLSLIHIFLILGAKSIRPCGNSALRSEFTAHPRRPAKGGVCRRHHSTVQPLGINSCLYCSTAKGSVMPAT